MWVKHINTDNSVAITRVKGGCEEGGGGHRSGGNEYGKRLCFGQQVHDEVQMMFC